MLKKIYLELTENCNLECEICFRNQWNEKPADMNTNLLQSVINQINSTKSVKTVVLGGIGEPLASPEFVSTVKRLADKEIWVTTNGTLLKEVGFQDVFKKLHLLIISIDGMEHQMLRSRGVVLKDLMANIDYVNRLKNDSQHPAPFIDIQFVASRKNIDEIFPLMDLLATKNIRNIIVSHLSPTDPAQAHDILYKLHGNDETKSLFNKIRNYSFRRGLKVMLPEVELKTERKCAFVSNHATLITSKGEIVPCYRLAHSGKEVVFGRLKSVRQYSFGNLHSKSIDEIWNSDNYRRFREKILNHQYPSCPDCDLVEGCSLVTDVEFDCHGEAPNCADCLWARKFIFCN